MTWEQDAAAAIRGLKAEIERLRAGLQLIAGDKNRLMNEVARQTAASILGGKPIGEVPEWPKRDVSHAQSVEEQRFLHGAPAVCNHFPGQQDCEWCRATPSASEVPVEESAACEIERANRVYGRGAHTLMELMKAYERRVRSDCTSQADIDARPWECAEYRAAADYLRKTWPRAADELDRLNAQALDLCAEISGLRRENESMRHDLGVLRGHHHEGCMAEIERLRGELLLISQLQAGDGSTINGLTKDQLGRAFRQAQDIARAALAGAADQPSAALTRDAARYRWLRVRASQSVAYDRYGDGCHWSIGFFSEDSRKGFDAAVDENIPTDPTLPIP
jgi:hypothetical protein